MPPDAVRTVELSKQFHRRGGSNVLAVNGVTLTVPAGGSVGIVGESGSGKTTTARMIVGLETPTSGSVEIFGRTRSPRPGRAERKEFAKLVQMVFQDPYGSLDPSQSIGSALAEVLAFHGLRDRERIRARVVELLESVGIPSARTGARTSELSGGQRQRVAIARALAAEPKLLVLDEAVSALDVSIQAQILNLLTDLRARLGLAYLVISHDIAVVRHLAEDVLVMLGGSVIEAAPADDILSAPKHAYTRSLIDSIPRGPGSAHHAGRKAGAGLGA